MLHIAELGHAYHGTPVLSADAFDLGVGQRALLLGPSGSGKSMLLNLIGAILTPQSGSITVAGTALGALTPRAADAWRGAAIACKPAGDARAASQRQLN